jgi:hypothetical protein
MKKNAIRIFVLLGLILTTYQTIINPTIIAAEASNKSEVRISKAENKLRKANQLLSQKFYTKQQSSHNSRDWFKFVKNLRLLKNNQIEIYVNNNFSKLKESQKQDLLNRAQLFVIRTTDQFKDFDQSAYLDGLSAVIFCDGEYLGRSKYLDNKDYVWYK